MSQDPQQESSSEDPAGLRPEISAAEARDILRVRWSLEAEVTPLDGERDRNFRARCDGFDGVLKVSPSGVSRERLEFEHRVMAHVAKRTSVHIATPRPPIAARGAGAGITVTTALTPRGTYPARLLSYLEGEMLARLRPRDPGLLEGLGRMVGEVDHALAVFPLAPGDRPLFDASGDDGRWHLENAGGVIATRLAAIEDLERRALVAEISERFDEIAPRLPELPRSLVHHDANDWNVLCTTPRLASPRPVALLDWGDMSEAATVVDLAVAIAYAVLEQGDPLAVAASVTRGYNLARPLAEAEVEVLFDLIRARLAVSVSISAARRREESASVDAALDPYLSVSEAGAWKALEALALVPGGLASATLRAACGFEPVPGSAAMIEALASVPRAAVLPGMPEPSAASSNETEAPTELPRVDLSVGSPLAAQSEDAAGLARDIDAFLAGRVGVGAWGEVRALYRSAHFETANGWRSMHMGVDLFAAAGTPVRAPLAGVIESVTDNDLPLDYGPTVIMRHDIEVGGRHLRTLYGHLSRESIAELAVGQRVECREAFARLGALEENGGWPPHLHLQCITDALDHSGNYLGVAVPDALAVWSSLSPDPSPLLGFDVRARRLAKRQPASRPDLLARRAAHVPPNLSLSYDEPLVIERGRGAVLYDGAGQAFIDLVNNVCHVGHSHPRVVRAMAEQAVVLNTNSRYLHPLRLEYLERLLAKFPEPLDVCFLVNSGSEANDLALRIAHTVVSRRRNEEAHPGGVVCVDGAYHGNLSSLIDVSPYKHDGPGGSGAPPTVRTALLPCRYRGAFGYDEPDAAAHYAESVREATEAFANQRGGLAAFIAEPILSCGGQITPPAGWLARSYEHVRRAGGLCIADEVQVGFGRVGETFWAFEGDGVVPDIVTLGKPMGNGHPLAGVVTTRAIAAEFNNGMEYFNTFGGNPVSCAVGLAVLEVIESEGLQAHAAQAGEVLTAALREMQEHHPLVGDVRGRGLFLGFELVCDRETKEPAAAEARWLVNRLRERGFLASTDGPLHNVIKIKPPLAISIAQLEAFACELDDLLGSTPLTGGAARPLTRPALATYEHAGDQQNERDGRADV